jgi:hypothetical protein
LGASWEGFAIEQVLAVAGERDAYYWATYAGAELDLVIGGGSLRWGFEFKCTDVPKMTKSLWSALEELHPAHIWVVYPGKESFKLHDKVSALGIGELRKAIATVTGKHGRRGHVSR